MSGCPVELVRISLSEPTPGQRDANVPRRCCSHRPPREMCRVFARTGARHRDHRKRCGDDWGRDPAIAGPIAIFDDLPTTDADRRSFTTFTKRDGRQLILAAVW